MDEKILEQFYQERLEERIIKDLSDNLKVSKEEAMDIYYNSKLADMIAKGTENIQYLDYKVLSQIIRETEIGQISC